MTQQDFDALKIGDWVLVAKPHVKSGHRRFAGMPIKLRVRGANGRWYSETLKGFRATALYFDPPDCELPARLGWPKSCLRCGAPAYHGLKQVVCSAGCR